MRKTVTTTLSIIAITNNQHKRQPRKPLVQLIQTRYGHVASIVFSPDEAFEVAKMIASAAKAAKSNRKIAPKLIEVQDD